MNPSDAKKVALGNADPVTLLPMEDINPTYVPRVPLNSNILNYVRQDNGKGKAKAAGKSASEGILHFFGACPLSYPTLELAGCFDMRVSCPV
jgi:exonuclease-1